MDATDVATDCDEDYEDVPYEDGAAAWVDIEPNPEERPTKRSCTEDKATAVSLYFELSRPLSDYILKQGPLEDLVDLRDLLMLELCHHEGLRGLNAKLSGFPRCGGCWKVSGTLCCTKCTIDAMFCSGCMCARHREQPLHRIQVRSHYVCLIRIDLKAFVAMDGLFFYHTFAG